MRFATWLSGLMTAALLMTSGALARRYPDGSYGLSESHSAVKAKVGFFGVSHKTVSFPRLEGEFQYRATGDKPFSLLVTADATQLVTGSSSDDETLKSADFFDTARFPRIIFRGTRLTFTGAKSAMVDGVLQVRGQERPMTLKVAFNQPLADMIREGKLVLSAQARFKRSSFGMKAWTPVVSDKVDLSISAQFDTR